VDESTIIDASNDELQIKLDGSETVTVRLTQGTYTQAELASEVQRAVNSHSSLSGRSVSVAAANNRLTITSASYGRASSIILKGGTALNALGFKPDESDIGQDVVGSFIVNGKSEAATGQGTLLVAKSGNENTDGLQVRVTLKDGQIVAGAEATLTITRGLAAELDLTLDQILNSEKGQLKTVNDSYDDRVESLQKSIDRMNAQFEARRESLVQQFVRLETNLSQFQTLGSYLSAQLGSLSSLRG
jgi:flagellar hook-associated protein 2